MGTDGAKTVAMSDKRVDGKNGRFHVDSQDFYPGGGFCEDLPTQKPEHGGLLFDKSACGRAICPFQPLLQMV